MMNKQCTCLLTIAFLTACGGGSGENSGGRPGIQTGVFIDSPVMGLAYSTATRSGLTDSAGRFEYLAGEEVTFSLGGIEFGSATGAQELTPLSLVGAESLDDVSQSQRRRVTNMLILLQSLDRDANPANGIDLGQLNLDLEDEQLEFDLEINDFRSGRYQGLIAEHQGRFLDEYEAISHFLESIDRPITVALPATIERDIDGDGVIDSTQSREYDDKGRLTKVTSVSGQTNTLLTYEYIENGNSITTYRSGSGSPIGDLGRAAVRYREYDDWGNLILETNGTKDSEIGTQTTYDRFGRIQAKRVSTNYRSATSTFQLYGTETRGQLFSHFGFLDSEWSSPVVSFCPGGCNYTGIKSEEFEYHYSEEGYVDIVEVSTYLKLEGEDEETLQVEETRIYNSAGNLTESVVQIINGSEIVTEFNFQDETLFNDCRVSIDGTEVITRELILELDAGENINFQYSGRCERFSATKQTLRVDGRPELIEELGIIVDPPELPIIIDLGALELFGIAPNSIFLTWNLGEFIYEADRLVRVNLFNDENPFSIMEFGNLEIVETLFDADGVKVLVSSKMTLEEFELDELNIEIQQSSQTLNPFLPNLGFVYVSVF